MKHKIILTILLMVIMIGCYEDKGNYDYREIQTIELDTTGKNFSTVLVAYQFEVLKIPVNEIISYSGNSEDLRYQWSVCPKGQRLPEGVHLYDSAKLISEKPNLDEPIQLIPGDYYLLLRVQETIYGTIQYFRLEINVQSRISKGLCVFYDSDKGGDLAVIKSKLLMPEVTENAIYYNLYTGINEDRIDNGRFMGMYSNSLYLFTEDGGVAVNGNTYKVSVRDYKQLFYFPLSIVPNPQAYILSSNIELIVNNGSVHCFNHSNMGTSAFGDRLDGDYEAASFLARVKKNFAAVIYDKKRNALRPINQFGSIVGEFADNSERNFNLNNIGSEMELCYLGNGYNDYTYTLFRNKEEYKLYIADIAMQNAQSVHSLTTLPISATITNWEFAVTGEFAYCTNDEDLYLVNYMQNKCSKIKRFHSEKIIKIKILEAPTHTLNNKLLMIATNNSMTHEGSIYLIPFNGLNGVLQEGEEEVHRNFGKIIDFILK